jgi:transcriptional regulator with XRE-family HTH domain
MATQIKTPSVEETPDIAELLREARGTRTKAEIYRELGVGAGTYNTWEAGMYVPGDEFAEKLAELLERELGEIVWILYASRVRQADFPRSRDIPRYRDFPRKVAGISTFRLPEPVEELPAPVRAAA